MDEYVLSFVVWIYFHEHFVTIFKKIVTSRNYELIKGKKMSENEHKIGKCRCDSHRTTLQIDVDALYPMHTFASRFEACVRRQ